MTRRILINANLYGTGGRETHLVKLSELLVNAGSNVTVVSRVVTPGSAQIIEALNSIPVRLLSTPFASRPSSIRLSTLWAMMAWPLNLRRRSFDALYTFDDGAFTSFLRRFVLDQGKIVLNRAGDLMRSEDVPSKTTAQPDVIIVESDLQARAVLNVLPGANVVAIPSLGHYQSPPRRINRPRDTVLEAAFLGRYEEKKGALRLLDIWSNLQDSQMRLSFYGHGDRVLLQRAIDAKGLAERVIIKHGWRGAEELSTILAQTDFVVLPSQTEGLPITLLESISHGVPFVATDVGAIRTLAEGNPDVVVTANDLESIRKGIDEMVQKIRSGKVDGPRLQQYSLDRFKYDRLAVLWQEVLQVERTVQRTTGTEVLVAPTLQNRDCL